jgi:hypothetical protein
MTIVNPNNKDVIASLLGTREHRPPSPECCWRKPAFPAKPADFAIAFNIRAPLKTPKSRLATEAKAEFT